jgi:arabinogalactan endo-1,4-beta-galactosidase
MTSSSALASVAVALHLGALGFGNGVPIPSQSVEVSKAQSLGEIRGADVSLLSDALGHGFQYRNSAGQAVDVLKLLKQAGCNTVRLRLWHTPAPEHSSSNTESVRHLAEQARGYGLQVLLTIHYSDHWADPGQQTIPKAWKDLSPAALREHVEAYTYEVVRTIQPQLVQVGNEINGGLLWPVGSVERPEQMLDLLRAGIRGCRRADPGARVVLHYAGSQGSLPFFDRLQGLDFDVLGLSYYPHWHGKELRVLQDDMAALQRRWNKPVLIVETSYPFTLEWDDWTTNTISTQGLLPDHPATPRGQAEYLIGLKARIRSVPGGAGLVYWGGEWVSYRGQKATNGSPWENQALFDFEGRALPAIQALGQH